MKRNIITIISAIFTALIVVLIIQQINTKFKNNQLTKDKDVIEVYNSVENFYVDDLNEKQIIKDINKIGDLYVKKNNK